MKIYLNQISSLIQNINSNKVKALLFHGPNYGQSISIIERIVQECHLLASSFSKKDVSSSMLIAKSVEKNFFAKKEIIKIKDTTSIIDKHLKDMLISEKTENILCFISSESLPNSGIRKLFETESHLASIACYYENTDQIIRGVLEKLNKNSTKIDEEAIFYLKKHLKGDTQIINNEIDKLLMFTHDKKLITKEDVSMVISSELIANGDEMCLFYALGMYKMFFKEMNKLLKQNINEILIIRAFIRFYGNLYHVTQRLEDGENIDVAIKKLKTSIFFKYIPKFKEIAMRISSKDATNMISKLMQLELDFKKNPRSFNLFQSLLNA